MTVPANLPEPVVFGPDFPQFKMFMRGGRQVFESRTNQNLFLSGGDFGDFDNSGTFTMGNLIGRLGSWKDALPLLFSDWYVDSESDRLIDWVDWVDTPCWEESPTFERLLGYCDTEHQKHFLLRWCEAQYTSGLGAAFHARRSELAEYARRRGVRFSVEGDHFGSWEIVIGDMLLKELLDFPALIPEVWLNYVGYDKTAQDEEHLSTNPQRVDFVLFANGRKCVIEIDGPSHYADYMNSAYVVSQRRYAKNLAIERSLRRQGWQIHRFANIEVDEAGNVEAFAQLVRDVPGFRTWRKRASVQSLAKLFGPIEDFV